MPSIGSTLLFLLAAIAAVDAIPTIVLQRGAAVVELDGRADPGDTPFSTALEPGTAVVELDSRANPGNTPFLSCVHAIPGWPKVSKDAVRRCASGKAKRDPSSAQYTPGDYARCIDALPAGYNNSQVLGCEGLLPQTANLKPRTVVGPLNAFNEFADQVCSGAQRINWNSFVSMQTITGMSDQLCRAACGATVSIDDSGTKTSSFVRNIHGLRQIGITFAVGPQVRTVLTIIDLGINFMGPGGQGVDVCAGYCNDAIAAGLDFCVDHATAGLEHADAAESFTSFIFKNIGDGINGALAAIDLSFP